MPPNLPSEIAGAFTHMSRARVLNTLYAKRAKRNKMLLLARLLDTISLSEHIQARRTLMYIRGKIGDVNDYLEHLVSTKQTDATNRYPQLCELLSADGQRKAAEAFEQFAQVAAVHRKLLEDVINKADDDQTEYYICQICGYVDANHPPDNCPVCNAVREKFHVAPG